jgi:D-alanyl-D-alanine-carboxypeptidase/D-alanyl-D-alanine-endopeptidase
MRALIASLLFLSLVPVHAQTTTPAVSLHDLKEAETLGANLYSNSGATGIVLVVVRGQEVFFRGYGETAPGSHQVPAKDSVVRLCSLTKTFTADLLAKLAADHTVKLNDTLQRYAPPEGVVPQSDKPITLLDLATHTAGLPREIGTPPRGTPHFTYPDYATRWQWLEKERLLNTPGTVALYSNVGFDLLADALAYAAHRPYAALLASRTLTPLHMGQTTYFPDPAQCARLLRGANDEGPCTTTQNTIGSSGLYSTPADMAKWLVYLLGTGAPAQSADAHAVYLLPSQLVRESGLDHAGRPSGIGLAWLHLGATGDPEQIIEKTGGGAGFLTYIAIHPASHTALFLAGTDGPRGAGTRGFNWFKAANNALLELAGLPPSQNEFERRATPHLARAARHRRTHKAMRRKRRAPVVPKTTAMKAPAAQ